MRSIAICNSDSAVPFIQNYILIQIDVIHSVYFSVQIDLLRGKAIPVTGRESP
jgi:hypothetical protein